MKEINNEYAELIENKRPPRGTKTRPHHFSFRTLRFLNRKQKTPEGDENIIGNSTNIPTRRSIENKRPPRGTKTTGMFCVFMVFYP